MNLGLLLLELLELGLVVQLSLLDLHLLVIVLRLFCVHLISQGVNKIHEKRTRGEDHLVLDLFKLLKLGLDCMALLLELLELELGQCRLYGRNLRFP